MTSCVNGRKGEEGGAGGKPRRRIEARSKGRSGTSRETTTTTTTTLVVFPSPGKRILQVSLVTTSKLDVSPGVAEALIGVPAETRGGDDVLGWVMGFICPHHHHRRRRRATFLFTFLLPSRLSPPPPPAPPPKTASTRRGREVEKEAQRKRGRQDIN